MLTETLASDTRADKIAGHARRLAGSVATRCERAKTRLSFRRLNKRNVHKASRRVYPNTQQQPSVFMHLGEAGADECTSVYTSVSACPDKNATTEIMGLFMGNGADASRKYSKARGF